MIRKRNGGFTMAEVMTVVVILAIVAAIAIPSLINLISNAEQSARMTNARTLFLSAQTALTSGAMGSEVHSPESDGSVDISLLSPPVSADELSENSENIVFLAYSMNDANKADDPLYKLLDPYISNKELLSQTLLMEYNRLTGNVLSMFCSDDAASIGYASDSEYNASDRSEDSLRRNRVGYYGVSYTGHYQPKQEHIDGLGIELVDYDGYETNGSNINHGNNYGLLTVECVLPDDPEIYSYEINLYTTSGARETVTVSDEGDITLDQIRSHTTLTSALQSPFSISVNGYTRNIIAYTDISSSSKEMIVLVVDSPLDGLSIAENYKRIAGGYLLASFTGYNDSSSSTEFSTAEHSLFADDDGNSAEIKSARHLNNIRYMASGAYRQVCNLTARDHDGRLLDFQPLTDEYNDQSSAFKGNYSAYNGEDSYSIMDLTITGGERCSLFDSLSSAASVSGLTLSYTTGYTGGYISASDAAAGIAVESAGSIENCTVEADITLTRTGSCAGIVAVNTGDILNCRYEADITTLQQDSSAAGIASENSGEIQRCSVKATLTSEGDSAKLAGIAAVNDINASIKRCSADIRLIAADENNNTEQNLLGGVCSQNRSAIENSYSKGSIVGATRDDAVGGIAAWSYAGSSLVSCFSEAKLSQALYLGGIAGVNEGSISMCSFKGSLSEGSSGNSGQGGSASLIGGIAGQNNGRISGSTLEASAVITPGGNELAVGGISGRNFGTGSTVISCKVNAVIISPRVCGGVTGENFGAISDCGINANVSSTGTDAAGGIAGSNNGTISACRQTVGITVSSNGIAGGVSGSSSGSITGCSSLAVVQASQSGGITGTNSGNIISCSSGANITGTNSAGGIAGSNTGSITGSTALASIQSSAQAGGIAGTSSGSISSCSSKANVTGTNLAGGIAGLSSGNISNCSAGIAAANDTYHISATGGGSSAGGIAGRSSSGTISGCANAAAVTGGSNAGGITGELTASTVTLSYNAGSISASACAGGLIGYMSDVSGMLSSSYNTGCVNASTVFNSETLSYDITALNTSSNSGGLAGECAAQCTISDCYSIGIAGDSDCGCFGLTNHLTNVSNCAFLENPLNTSDSVSSVNMLDPQGLRAASFTGMQAGSLSGVGAYHYVYPYISTNLHNAPWENYSADQLRYLSATVSSNQLRIAAVCPDTAFELKVTENGGRTVTVPVTTQNTSTCIASTIASDSPDAWTVTLTGSDNAVPPVSLVFGLCCKSIADTASDAYVYGYRSEFVVLSPTTSYTGDSLIIELYALGTSTSGAPLARTSCTIQGGP